MPTAKTAKDKPPPPPPQTISIAEMTTRLGISKRHALRLLDEGVVESRYLGRRRLVSMASLTAYWESLPTERE